jgi:hypothetical protein
MSGHQHEKETVHDMGKGHADKGLHGEHAGGKDKEAGGGRREHRASGSHDYNVTGTDAKEEHTTGTGRNYGGSSGD